LAAGGFFAAAAVQACSPGTLEDSDAYKDQVDMYAPSTGSGGGVSVGTGGGGSVATGGKAGVGTGGVGTGGGAAVQPDSEFYPAGCNMQPLIVTTCMTSFCHSGKAEALGKPYDLVTAPVWKRMFNQPASYDDGFGTGTKSANCPTTPAKLIDSLTPADSWVLKKITGEQGMCGGGMPAMGGITNATTKKCFQDWIMNIATNGKM